MKALLRKLDKYQNQVFILINALTTLSLIFLQIKHLLYFQIFLNGFILSYYLLSKSSEARLGSLLLLSFFFGSGVLILCAGILALVEISINEWVFLLPFGINLFLQMKNPIRLSSIDTKIDKADWLLIALLLLAIGSRVVSIKGFVTPILHDPISHATWAKQIFLTGKINYFYSPGLHILAALGMLSDGVNVATYILRLTNIFNAILFIPVYFSLKLAFKNELSAVCGAIIFLLGPLPTNFFWLSGKNSLIVGLPFLFLLLLVIQLDITNIKKIFFGNAIVFVLILVHYPVAAIALLIASSVLVFQKNIKGLLIIVFGITLGIIWGIIKMRYQVELSSESVRKTMEALQLTYPSIKKFLIDFLKQASFQYTTGDIKWLDFFGHLGILLAIIAPSLKNMKWLPLSLLGVFAATLIINFTPLRNSLFLLHQTLILTYFILIYVGIACLIKLVFELFKWEDPVFSSLIFAIVIVLVAINSHQVYKTYRTQQSKLNLVSQNDLDAFKWIDENLEDDSVFLNNAAQNNRSFIVFSSDGAAWIPVFTDNEIAMPFTEFSSETTHSNYSHYNNLLTDATSCEDIDYLYKGNIHYYYKDSQGVFGPQLVPSKSNENFELVYDSSGTKIYRLIPCQP